MNAMKPFLFLLLAGLVHCCELTEVDKRRARCHQTAKRLDDEKNNNLNFLNQLLPKERTRYMVDAQKGKKDYHMKNYKMTPFASEKFEKHSVDIPQIIASCLEPQEMHRMKATTKNLNKLKITGKLNLFPNESSVQVFRDLEAKNGFHEITWEDPHNLIPNQRRTNLENCLGLAGNVLDPLSVKVSAERLIDELSGWGFTKPEFYPFFKMVLKNVLKRDVVDAENKKKCKKLLMREAIVSNSPEDVFSLISRKKNMNFEEIVDDKVSLEEPIDSGDYKPLFFALSYDSRKDNFEIAKILLKAGAEVNSEDKFGRIALTYPASNGKLEVVKLLLENNAEVNPHYFSEWRQTPLHGAATYDRVEVVKFLLDAGADVNAEDHDHRTPLMKSALAGSVESAEALIQRGAKLNISDKNGRTALIWAAKWGHIEVVKLLLDAGAKVGTAAEIAQQNGHQNCADLINDYAARFN